MATKLKMEKTHQWNKMSDMQRLGRWVNSCINGLFVGLKGILKEFTTVLKGQYISMRNEDYKPSYILNKTSV